MQINSSEQSPCKVHNLFRWIQRKGCSKTTNCSHLSIKKLYSGLFLKKISEKLVNKESKVVHDRQHGNVLRDLLNILQGYLTFCGQLYSFHSLLHPDMRSKSKKESFSGVILVKVKSVMLVSLNIHEFLSSQ